MSYKDGLRAMGGNNDVKGVFFTKDDANSHLLQTASDMDFFKGDVARWAQGKEGDDRLMAASFNEFYARWVKFLSNMMGKTYSTTESENWRRRLIGWRKTFVYRGMRPTTPDPELNPPETPHIVPIMVAAAGTVTATLLLDWLLHRRK
jgi:hypothetical protein